MNIALLNFGRTGAFLKLILGTSANLILEVRLTTSGERRINSLLLSLVRKINFQYDVSFSDICCADASLGGKHKKGS